MLKKKQRRRVSSAGSRREQEEARELGSVEVLEAEDPGRRFHLSLSGTRGWLRLVENLGSAENTGGGRRLRLEGGWI